ncbi:MAG: YitT family protein [Clostridia bacterium]|nr:YitT family protein [Clostridia bacterium]
MKRKLITRWIIDCLYITLGAAIYALGYTIFIRYNSLTPGGINGIATQISALTSLPPGMLSLAMSIPLLILGFWQLGAHFFITTTISTVLSSVFMDTFDILIGSHAYEGEMLVVALFGGALSGIGIALPILRGASAGGNDIIAQVVNRHWPNIPVGKFLFGFNMVVFVSAAFVYGNIESALCSAVVSFVSSYVIDAVLLGVDSGKSLMIVTENPYELAKAIHNATGRGATVIPAYGTYQHEQRSILMCVARRRDIVKIRRVLKTIDPSAFVIIQDTSEIFGKNFKSI